MADRGTSLDSEFDAFVKVERRWCCRVVRLEEELYDFLKRKIDAAREAHQPPPWTQLGKFLTTRDLPRDVALGVSEHALRRHFNDHV